MKNSRKKVIMMFITLYCIFMSIASIVAFVLRNSNEEKYILATNYYNSKDYAEAYEQYKSLGEYKDSKELAEIANLKKNEQEQNSRIYNEAINYYNDEDFKSALEKFKEIENYEDSAEYINKCKFNLAVDYYEDGNYEEAKPLFEEVGNQESKWYLAQINVKNLNESKKIIYDKAYDHFKNEQYIEALEGFKTIQSYKESKKFIKHCEDKLRKKLSHTIASGANYFLAITKNNNVESCGQGDYNQCNVVSWKDIVSIDGYSECTIGLKSNGKVKISGTLNYEQKKKLLDLKHVIDVAAGEKFVATLKSDGKVVVDNRAQNIQRVTDNWKEIVDIDCGWGFIVGLDKKGNLHFAGNYDENEKNHSPKKDDWKDVVKISASGGDTVKFRGGGHVVGLKSNGKVVAVGDNDFGQCDIKDWEDIVEIAAGDWYTVGLTSKGKIKITGENNPNGIDHTVYKNKKIMSEWNKVNIKDIAAGYGITLVLNENGKLDAMGFVSEKQRKEIKNWKIKLKEK